MSATLSLRPARGIRSYLTILVLATALPLAALVGFRIYSEAADNVRSEAEASTRIAQQAAQFASRFLDDASVALESLAQRRSRLLDAAICESVVAVFASLNPLYANIAVRDRDGAPVCSARGRAGVPGKMHDPASFDQAVRENRMTFSTPRVDALTKRWSIGLRQPIRDDRGQVIGVITLPLELVRLQAAVGGVQLPLGGVIAIIGSDGTILARSLDAEKWVGKSTRGAGIVATSPEGKRGWNIARGVDGIERAYGFASISHAGWSVLSGIPIETIHAPSRRAALHSTLMFLAITAVVAVLAGAITRSIASPMRRLSETAETVASGRFDARAAVSGPAEIAAVSRQFNRMLDVLEQGEAALRDSEERLRLATEAAQIGTWDWDTVTNRVRWDPVLLRLFGLEAGQLSADIKAWFERVHPEDRPRLETAIRNALHDRAQYAEEFRIVVPGGEMRWIAAEGQALGGLPGPAVRMIGVARDITERQRAEEALRESEERRRNVLDSMFPFVGLLSLDGRVLEANRAPLEAAGLAREDVIGMPCAEIWWYSYSPAVQERLRAALARAATGEVMRYDETIRIAGGRFITIDLMFRPLRESDGRVSAIVGSAIDITDRKRAEEALRSSEERLRLTIQAGDIGLWYWDLGTNQVTYSREWKGQLGYSDHEIGDTFREWESRVHPDDLAPTLDQIQAYIAKPEGMYKAEFRMRHKDGSWRWILAHGQVFHDRQGRTDRMMGCHIDITDRKEAELASRSERDFSESVLNSLPGVFYCYDESRRFLRWNRNFEQVTGYSGAEIARMSPLDFFAGADRDLLAARIEEVFDRGTSAVDANFVAKDGSRTPYHFTGLAAEIAGRRCLVGVGIDISAHTRAEADLHELSRRLIEAEETERRNINRELHDRIGQNLSVLNLNLGIVRSQLPKSLPRALNERFDDARKLLETTSQQVRDVMADLRPAALDDYGLLAALRAYTGSYSRRVGVPVTVHGCDLAPRPPLATELALFRIAQEALNNVFKHAKVRHAEIHLDQDAGMVRMTVADDGVGFDPATPGAHATWGMTTMRERAEAVGARLRIESAPGEGTRVVVEVPARG